MYRDHIDNILGVDSSNNIYTSTNVAANRDGSMIERLEFIHVGGSAVVTKDLAAAALTGSAVALFNVTGPVLVKHLGFQVTTAIPAGANTFLFAFDVGGAGVAANLCAALDTASAALNQLFVVDGVKATTLVKVSDPGIMVAANETAMPIILSTGVITYTCSAGPPATGGVKVYIEYEPLAPTAIVTAA